MGKKNEIYIKKKHKVCPCHKQTEIPKSHHGFWPSRERFNSSHCNYFEFFCWRGLFHNNHPKQPVTTKTIWLYSEGGRSVTNRHDVCFLFITANTIYLLISLIQISVIVSFITVQPENIPWPLSLWHSTNLPANAPCDSGLLELSCCYHNKITWNKWGQVLFFFSKAVNKGCNLLGRNKNTRRTCCRGMDVSVTIAILNCDTVFLLQSACR